MRRGFERLSTSITSLPLLSRVVAGSALVSVLVAGAFAILMLAIADLRGATTIQAQSKDVTAATLGLERVVNELEASLRAFVISGEDQFLVSWRAARSEMWPAIVKVQKLVDRQPSQNAQAQELAILINQYIGEYGLPLIKIARTRPVAARAPVVTSEGLLRINAIRGLLASLLESEDRLASVRAASAEHEAGRALQVGVAALVAAAGLLVLFGVFLARAIVRPVRMLAVGAGRVAAGDLSTRLPEGGAAEIHELTRAFNLMARSLDQGKRELEAQNEELRQSERLKSELISIVSHELRTPLASIIGYARLLLTRDVPKAEAARYLEIIQTQGSRLASLVESFLDLEQVETGRIELKDELLDLKSLLLEESELVSATAANHEVRVIVGAEALPVRGDRDRLSQVYGNLLANAIKYSPEGGSVEVVGEIAADMVRVEVRDEGIGIPREHHARIFSKFFRAEARESGIAGSGLGLAISREIVEEHGGRIGFTSEPGVGSAFWFELPLAGEPQGDGSAKMTG